MQRMWSSKVKTADRKGWVPLLPTPTLPAVPNRDGVVDEEDEDAAGVIDDLAGLWTVTWRHLESSLSVTTSTSWKKESFFRVKIRWRKAFRLSSCALYFSMLNAQDFGASHQYLLHPWLTRENQETTLELHACQGPSTNDAWIKCSNSCLATIAYCHLTCACTLKSWCKVPQT